MKFFNQNKWVSISLLAIFFCGIGFLLNSYLCHKKENIQSDLTFLKLDAYRVQAFLSVLDSIDPSRGISVEQFVQCALQDQYKRIQKNISFLEDKKESYYESEITNVVEFLVDNKGQIEDYWSENQRFDCKSINWNE